MSVSCRPLLYIGSAAQLGERTRYSGGGGGWVGASMQDLSKHDLSRQSARTAMHVMVNLCEHPDRERERKGRERYGGERLGMGSEAR